MQSNTINQQATSKKNKVGHDIIKGLHSPENVRFYQNKVMVQVNSIVGLKYFQTAVLFNVHVYRLIAK